MNAALGFLILFSTFLMVCGQQNAINKIFMNKINSETLPGNLLPNFLFMQGSIEGIIYQFDSRNIVICY